MTETAVILACPLVVCQYFLAGLEPDLTKTAVILAFLLVVCQYFPASFDPARSQLLRALSVRWRSCAECRELACRSERIATAGDVQGVIYASSPVLGQIWPIKLWCLMVCRKSQRHSCMEPWSRFELYKKMWGDRKGQTPGNAPKGEREMRWGEVIFIFCSLGMSCHGGLHDHLVDGSALARAICASTAPLFFLMPLPFGSRLCTHRHRHMPCALSFAWDFARGWWLGAGGFSKFMYGRKATQACCLHSNQSAGTQVLYIYIYR